MQEFDELQQRRAANIIWTAAGRHDFTPDFFAYDENGNAELYRNIIIGALRRHTDYEKIDALFNMFSPYEEAEDYRSLLWLGLEGYCYQKEVENRPALITLRRVFANEVVLSAPHLDDFSFRERLELAHYKRVLGLEDGLDTYEKELLDRLEFDPSLDTQQIFDKTRELFSQWFAVILKERKEKRRKNILSALKIKGKKAKSIGGKKKRFSFGFLQYSGGGVADGEDDPLKRHLKTKLSLDQLRDFMAVKYGKSIFTPAEIKELERFVCRDAHDKTHLHITDGEFVNGLNASAFEAYKRNEEAIQKQKNRDYYKAHSTANSIAIQRLASDIRNSMLMYLDRDEVKSLAGQLNPTLLWRAPVLEDGRVFNRIENDNAGDVSVDILLDASTSQKNRQEIVSTQGYIIAESLTRCGIPCRISGFCSMTGFTIMRIYRDYYETGKNDAVFDFVANGCNRDGLAVRCAVKLMEKSSCAHRLLIILSDCKPNDVVGIRPKSGGEEKNYDGEPGVTNAVYEVRTARDSGISVICVFTGEDEDVHAARLIYGSRFARIKSFSALADTVGKLIRDELRNI